MTDFDLTSEVTLTRQTLRDVYLDGFVTGCGSALLNMGVPPELATGMAQQLAHVVEHHDEAVLEQMHHAISERLAGREIDSQIMRVAPATSS